VQADAFLDLGQKDSSVLASNMFTHRLAVPADMPMLEKLMHAAIRRLLSQDLSPEKVEASFSIMGLDSQLICDGTYFVVQEGGQAVGCGGWSRRATLFGHNQTAGRDSRLLDPAHEPARIRAMYTHPDFARRGVGRYILDLSEASARNEGFASAELGATASGVRLYRACGYTDVERLDVTTPGGVSVPITRMRKIF
jgi:GNAT superfamily N-acetyltransferase